LMETVSLMGMKMCLVLMMKMYLVSVFGVVVGRGIAQIA